MITCHKKKATKKCTENKILQNLELINFLTSGEREIIVTLFDIQQARFFDNKSLIINPSCKYLAKKSKKSTRTIQSLNKKIRENKEFSETIKIRRMSKGGRRHLNEYEFSKDFMKALFLMKFCGSFYSKTYQQCLLTQYAENKEDVIKKLTFKLQKLRHAKPKNCGTLTTFFNIPNEDKVLSKKVPSIEENEKISFSWNGININTQQKKYFLDNYPIGVVKEGIKDFMFYLHKGNKVDSNFGVLYSQVKENNYMRAFKWRKRK